MALEVSSCLRPWIRATQHVDCLDLPTGGDPGAWRHPGLHESGGDRAHGVDGPGGRRLRKNALILVVTLIGLQLPILVGGSVIMENMFALPGLGRLMLEALTVRDYPVVSGINLFFATAVLTINLFIDILYGYLDPRVTYK